MSNGVKKMKIGILTYHKARNYGAFLQSCALCSRLNQEADIDAEIIDFRMKKEENMYSLSKWSLVDKLRFYHKYKFTGRVYRSFERADFSMEGMRLSGESLTSDSMDDFTEFVKNKYDVIISGSDEVWKADSFRGFPTPYWLMGDLGCRKFSYAVSARNDFGKMSDENLSLVKKALGEFEFISVRDDATYEAIKGLSGGKKVYKCCDPSFVYDFNVTKKNLAQILKGKAQLDEGKKNVVVMTERPEIAAKIRRQLGNRYNLISVFHWRRGYINVPDLTPGEWLEVIGGADFVLASYFHAVCFSIVLGVGFLAIGSPGKSAKVKDLLKGSALENRYLDNGLERLDEIDLDSVIEAEPDLEEYKGFVSGQRMKFDALLEELHKPQH